MIETPHIAQTAEQLTAYNPPGDSANRDAEGHGSWHPRDHGRHRRAGHRSRRALVHSPFEDGSRHLRFRNQRPGQGADCPSRPGTLPAVKVARTVYQGGYEGLGGAWGELMRWIEAQGHTAATDLWECYLAGPESGPDPSAWRTELNRPLIH